MKEKLKNIFSLDLRSLALFRVLLGLIVILDCIYRLQDLTAFYTDRGVLPRDVLIEKFLNSHHFSLHFLNGLWGYQLILFLITIASAMCLTVGYRTKLFTIITWIMVISVQNRNYMVLNGGDVLLRMLLFWAMFLPLNYRFSVDCALSPKRPLSEDNRYFSIAAMALYLQMVMVYVFTALLKTGEEWLWDGTATYLAMQIDQFTTPIGKLFQDMPLEVSWVLTVPVWFWELLGPLLFFSPVFFLPLRYLAIAGFCLMHFCFGTLMHIGLFPFIDFASLLVMLPGHFWDSLGRAFRTPERLGLKLYYDGKCGFCHKIVLIIREFLLIPETPIIKTQEDEGVNRVMESQNTWVVSDASGTNHIRFDAIVTVLKHSPFVTLAPFPGILGKFAAWVVTKSSGLGDKLYNWVANNREKFSHFTAYWLPERPLHPVPTRSFRHVIGSSLALFFLIFCFYYNLTTLKSIRVFGVELVKDVGLNFNRYIPYPKRDQNGEWVLDAVNIAPIQNIGAILRLDQKWSMFSPYPLKDDGWYYTPGTLGDGKKVDVWNFSETPAKAEKPEMVAHIYPNQRWRKYMMNIWKKSHKDHRLYFGKWMCRTWNEDRAGDQRLYKWQLHFQKEYSTLKGPKPPEDVIIWRHECYKKETGNKALTH